MDMEQPSQEEIARLVKGARDKDQRSIEALYRMYYPKMKGVCIRIIKTDDAVSHDIVQNAFIHALACLDTLHKGERFGEWLTTITRNMSLRYLQKKNRVRFIPLSELSAEDVHLVSLADSPEALVNLNEIKALIRQLPKGYGEVFRMSVIEGYSHSEIGRILGIAPHSSSSQLARAKALLRQMLRDKRLAFVVLFLLLTVPCGILWMYHGKSEDGELAEEGSKAGRVQDDHPPVPSDSVGKAPLYPKPHLAKGTPQRVIIVAKDSVPGNIVKEKDNQNNAVVVDSNASATPPPPLTHTLAETTDSVADKVDSIMHSLRQSGRYVAEVTSKSHDSGWQLMAGGTISFEAEHNNNLAFEYTDDMPEPDGPSSDVPQNITTWEQYAQQLSMDVFENPTEEKKALLDVAQHNSGKIMETEHHSNPISIGIALSRTISKNLSVETGVQYDRLDSRFRMGSASSNVMESQSIDYLGIPLRMTYRLYAHKRFNIYGTAGVVLHIPLSGSCRGDYTVEGQKIHHTEASVSAPLQLALPLGLGAQYQLTRRISIYAQPTLNWYIPAGGTTRTMWTKYPWQVTLPVGVRITW